MINHLKFGATFFVLFLFSLGSSAKLVEYQFDIDYKSVNFTGETVKAMAIAGKIPGPTIEATAGDVLRVTFNNKMDVRTSIHWHGVLLPNEQDGVPYLTTPPIEPGSFLTYEFPIKHAGTYWYHSHTGLQEQRGVYGSLVFHPKENHLKATQEHVVVFSDWTDENPEKVLANLKKDGDYYALKKDSVQSWFKVIMNGHRALKNRLNGSWSRMGPMDISDVGYDAFLANGQKKLDLGQAKKGDIVLLRLINAAASSYFNIEFSGGNMTIVSADGMDVEPTPVSRLRMAIAETFDVLITIPEDKSYELRATAEDGTGYSSTYIGQGERVEANVIERPNLFLMDHSMHAMNQGREHIHHPGMMMDEKMALNKMMEYQNLRSKNSTVLPRENSLREISIELTGNMERYVWSLNEKTLSESDAILIKKGENVRFKLVNRTMMHHPIHLHGHFFRVLNGAGDFSPLKHTVNVPPMQTVEIEFFANEEKDWFFHCHNLYHMKSGMALVVGYEGSSRADKNLIQKIAGDRSWYLMGDLGIYTHMVNGYIRPSDKGNAFELEFDYDNRDEFEIEAIYERSITRFLDFYVGTELEREDGETESTAILGFHYVLPLLIELDARINSEGELRLGLESKLQLTDRLTFLWECNTDEEYQWLFDYELNKKLKISANYDSDYGVGAGVKFSF